MKVDVRTNKILEIERVLAELHPITPFGLKFKSAMKLYGRLNAAELQQELGRVELMMNLVNTQRTVFVEMRTSMRQLKDISRSIERCIKGGVLSTVELFELKSLVGYLNSISRCQSTLQWKIPAKYKVSYLDWIEEILDPEKTGLKTFYIYDCYSEKLSELRGNKSKLEQQQDVLKRQLIIRVEQDISMPVRANGEITISKSHAEVIEKLRAYKQLQIVNETYINITFKIKYDDIMQEYQKKIEDIKAEEALEEARVLEELSKKIAVRAVEILDNISALGEFDLLIAKAYLANSQNAVKPAIAAGVKLEIQNGRHPLVEASLRKKGKDYTPISISIENGVSLITGANMGGKTVTLKLVGLLTLMAHYGLLVPAESMTISMLEFLFISSGDDQCMDRGLSTFGAEIAGLREVIGQADSLGLILVDELARGTNPHEGYAISAAIIEYMTKKPCITLITTHFDGLAKPGIKHFQVAGLRNVNYDTVKQPENISEYMDYRLIQITREAQVPRDAINISKLFGLPGEIIDYAEKLMEGE